MNHRKIVTFIITCFMVSTIFGIVGVSQTNENVIDFDPLVDVIVTFELLSIRSLEKEDNHLHRNEYIDRYTAPDFFVRIWINDEFRQSKIWWNKRYIYDPQFSFEVDVPDDEELVNIKIQLWDWNAGLNRLCDISNDKALFSDSKDVELIYSIKYGLWWGDDFTSSDQIGGDPSGYGRLNGCDDGSIYQHDLDCELYFKIYQNDYDGDMIPYWVETNVYGTDPTVNNAMDDVDGDGVPFLWEYTYGHYCWEDWRTGEWKHEWIYHPLEWDDHKNLDPDNDGLTNYEEYLTWQWGSDPFRKDLFVEMDIMEHGPNGERIEFPLESKELLRTVHNRRNIVYHLDDGCMGGGEIIPFDELCTYNELKTIYTKYFLHNDENNWRRGIFHYGLVVNEAEGAYGFVFRRDAYQISVVGMEKKAKYPHLDRDIVYASAYMHECGHTLGIFHGNTPGCDDQDGKYPWQLNWWKWRPYKSVMNYGYMYWMLDYSDGSRGQNDFDDWNRLDFTFFQS
jgi:hypothetical protein